MKAILIAIAVTVAILALIGAGMILRDWLKERRDRK